MKAKTSTDRLPRPKMNRSRADDFSSRHQPSAGYEKSERTRPILVGRGYNELEERITDALCSGGLRLRESEFLQQISRKIGIYRERTLLSHRQAGWLFAILTSFEDETKNRRNK